MGVHVRQCDAGCSLRAYIPVNYIRCRAFLCAIAALFIKLTLTLTKPPFGCRDECYKGVVSFLSGTKQAKQRDKWSRVVVERGLFLCLHLGHCIVEVLVLDDGGVMP